MYRETISCHFVSRKVYLFNLLLSQHRRKVDDDEEIESEKVIKRIIEGVLCYFSVYLIYLKMGSGLVCWKKKHFIYGHLQFWLRKLLIKSFCV